MVRAGLRPPERECALGLEFYLTDTPPLPAHLKESPEDFEVREISLYPVPDPAGAFTILRVQSSDWEQHELADQIARRLRLSPHAVSWAGTKDRRAVAERLFSYRGSPPTGAFGLARVELLEAYSAREGLILGHHFGNSFRIRLCGIAEPEDAARAHLEATLGALRRAGGFVNLFGPQRFGEVRPVTHQVGREIVRGDLGAAVETYLAAPAPGEGTLGREARAEYAQHHNAARALAEFPPGFRFERQLLDHLARGHPPERALRALSRELRLLFVHAYQSLLFNRWLSERSRAGLPFDRPVDGDFLLRVRRDGTVPGTDAIPVEADNLPECAQLVARGGARVAGPLVGYETPRPGGTPGLLLERILDTEGVTRDDFRLPHTPEISSRGSWRPAFVPLPPIGARWSSAADGTPDVWLSFSLPKGSYATILLREILKPEVSAADE